MQGGGPTAGGATTVRPAHVGDLEAIEALGWQVVPPTYVDSGLLAEEEVRTLLTEFWSVPYLQSVLDGDGHLYVAEADGRVVGMCEVAYLSHDEAVMWKIYVEAELRGRGVGTQLLSIALRSLRRGTDRFFTEYVTGNEGAGAFYERRGFRLDRIEPDARPEVEVSYTWVVMDVDPAAIEDATDSVSA